MKYIGHEVNPYTKSHHNTSRVGKLAIRIGAVDKPNARKVHTHIMPRMGGLAIYTSAVRIIYAMQLPFQQALLLVWP